MSETKGTGASFGEISDALNVIKEHLASGRRAEEREAETIRRWQIKEDRYQEQIRTLAAEVERLKWELAGSPMPGETPQNE